MITYKTGSILDINISNKLTSNYIVHCVNDAGIMGSGVAKVLYDKWPKVKSDYVKWYESNNHFRLGQIQIVPVEDNLSVVNLIGQSFPGGFMGFPPVRYQSIEEALMRLNETIHSKNFLIHAPRFGCGLAGGSWAEIEKIINRVGLNFIIYDTDGNYQK